ncbi:MAG: tetratricopeptide repeat protein [Planctomycetota bacterium]
MAAKATKQFLSRWPNHNAATEVILLSLDHPVFEVNDFVDWMDLVAPDKWPPALLAVTLSESLEPKLFRLASQRLAVSDATGQHTAEALTRLSESEQFASAEQLAASILALDGESARLQPMACESIGRWAGRTDRWSMLALHAETVQPSNDGRRTPHLERLFAEALTREGNAATAMRWWAHVVDQRGATDFATRLRLAECCVAEASIDDAKKRVEQARSVATKPGARTLLDFLAADLEIRTLEFDAARRRYEAIIREASVTAELRGRAQWMIGETYLMQERFSSAIDAYRRVEGLDPDGRFVPPSLLQAGKAFEQLGRTREAAVCYGALVSRFAESHHASLARRRLTELPVDQEKQSIRR